MLVAWPLNIPRYLNLRGTNLVQTSTKSCTLRYNESANEPLPASASSYPPRNIRSAASAVCRALNTAVASPHRTIAPLEVAVAKAEEQYARMYSRCRGRARRRNVGNHAHSTVVLPLPDGVSPAEIIGHGARNVLWVMGHGKRACPSCM